MKAPLRFKHFTNDNPLRGMSTPKKARCFFSETPLSSQSQVVLLKLDEARHIQQTLRYKVGQEIQVTDGRGNEARAVILAFDKGQGVRVEVIELLSRPALDKAENPQIALYAAFAAKGVMDELVEKCQELGVADFYPMMTERTVVSLDTEKEGKVLDRWYKIARESAKQSKSTVLVNLHTPQRIEEALRAIPAGSRVLFFHPGPDVKPMREWRSVDRETSSHFKWHIFIGPEGGFSDKELRLAERLAEDSKIEIATLSLGKNILRVSTAVVAVIGALKFTS